MSNESVPRATAQMSEDPVNTVEKPAPETRSPDAPWFLRVLPVTGIALLALGLLTLFVPEVRAQVRLSVTRVPEAYVDLYFAEAPPGTLEGGQVTCTRKGADVVVDFVVRSHLAAREAIDYSVTVDPAGSKLETVRSTGSVRVSPGATRSISESLALARGTAYVVTVALPGREQLIRARCGTGQPA